MRKGCCSCLGGCLVAGALIVLCAGVAIHFAARSAQPVDLTPLLADNCDAVLLIQPVRGDDGWRLFMAPSEHDSIGVRFLKRRFRSFLPYGIGVTFKRVDGDLCRTVVINPHRFAPLIKVGNLPILLRDVVPQVEEKVTTRTTENLLVAGSCRERTVHVIRIFEGPHTSLSFPVTVPDNAEIRLLIRNRNDFLQKSHAVRAWFTPMTAMELAEIKMIAGWFDILDADRFTARFHFTCRHPLRSHLVKLRLKEAVEHHIEAWVREGGKLHVTWRVEGKDVVAHVEGSSQRRFIK